MSLRRVLSLSLCTIVLVGLLCAAPVKEPVENRNTEAPRVDLYGDPLPPGALARVGTVRFRHGSTVISVSFSPDGKTLAAMGFDAVRLWEVASGRELRHLVGDPPYYRGAYAPDGKTLWLQRQEGEIVAWDLTATGKPRLTPAPFDSKKSEFIAVAPNGKTVAAGSGNDVVLWDAVTGKEKARLKGLRYPAREVAFSADGKRLVAVTASDLILWEPATDKKLMHVAPPLDDRGHPEERFELAALSAAGRALAAVLSDSPKGALFRLRLRFWEADSGKEVRTLPMENVAPRSLAFSPDGKALALVGQQCLYVWDAATGKVRREYEFRSTQFSHVVFSPDGRTMAAGTTGGVRLWDMATGREICPIPEHRLGVGAIGLSRDGRRLITQDVAWGEPRDDVHGVPRLWDAATGRRLLSENDGGLPEGILSQDGSVMASWAGKDGILLWDARTGKRRHHVGAGERVENYWLAPDGKHLLALTKKPRPAAGDVSAMRLWETATGKAIDLFDDETGGNWIAGFSPDGKRMAVVFGDVVDVWDIEKRRKLPDLKVNPEKRVLSFAFSSDGGLLAFVEWEGRIRLYETDSGKELPSLLNEQTKEKLLQGSFATAFTPDVKTVLTTDNEGGVFAWERATGGLRLGWKAHECRVSTVCVSADGKVLATTGDGTALTWDPAALAGAREGLTPKELDVLWGDLGGTDAARAYRALWSLARNAERSVPLIEERLPAALKAEMRRADEAVAALTDKDASIRRNAVGELVRMRFIAEPALRRALAAKPAVAVREQIEALLAQFDSPMTSPGCLRIWRALEALEHAGTPKARALLTALAKETKDSRIAQEAKAALARLAAGLE